MFEEAKTHLTEWVSSYEKLTPMVWIAWNYANLASLHLDSREYDDAVNCYNKIIPIFESRSFMPSIIKLFQTSLLRVKVLKHDRDIELSGLFAYYENNKFTWSKARTARNIGDILINIDNNHLLDAEVWFRKAIDADKKNGFRWELAQDHACYAGWFRKKGDIQGAKEQLTKAIDIFRECGADGWVEKYEKELVQIST